MAISPRRSLAPMRVVMPAVIAGAPWALGMMTMMMTTAVAATPVPPPGDELPVRPARVVSRHVEAGYETLVASVEAGACTNPWNPGWQVRLDGTAGEPLPWSGVATQTPASQAAAPPGASLTLVLRRVVASSRAPALVHVDSPAGCGGAAGGQHRRFQLPETTELPDNPQALSTYLIELGQKLRFGSTFGAFAQARLHALVEERFRAAVAPPPAKPARARSKAGKGGRGAVVSAPASTPVLHVLPGATPRRGAADLASLMEAATSTASLQEMLQRNRRLVALAGDGPASIALDTLDAPVAASPQWRAMLAALAREVPAEPLAGAAPADFYFVRFASPASLSRLIAAATNLPAAGTVGVDVDMGVDRGVPVVGLVGRYLTELGLTPGARALLSDGGLVNDVALVGSDLDLRDGSDVTLIIRPRVRKGAVAPFARALGAMLAELGPAHGGLDIVESAQAGVVVRESRTADGAVHQHRASAGGFELISNSAAALGRVLAAIAGHAPRLDDQLDFRYQLARDAGVPNDALVFMSSRFFARVAGGRQKVLRVRRQLALAELETPGLAASLFGSIYGRAPDSVDQLLASGLLRKEELAHHGGEAITWTPGAAARSAWGTPSALTPLIDLPAPTAATPTERDAYRLWVQAHQRDGADLLAPVAVQVALSSGASAGADTLKNLRLQLDARLRAR